MVLFSFLFSDEIRQERFVFVFFRFSILAECTSAKRFFTLPYDGGIF